MNEITRQQIADCSVLGEIASLDATKYLAEYMGMPGLVKGVSGWGSGMLVFSENLKHFTRVCESRVAGNKIKFNYGSEEIKENRSACWQFCVKKQRIQVITRAHREDTIEYPFELLRPDDKNCPICLDPLAGNVVNCNNKHQTCLKCFNLQSTHHGVKKCVQCNTPTYSRAEYDRVDRMNGSLTREAPYFYLTLNAGNSFKSYMYNEALFLGMLKHQVRYNHMDNFRSMLISSFYNYYLSHNDAFSTYNFNLTHYLNTNRSFKPNTDPLGDAIVSYVDGIYTGNLNDHYKAIYTDVAHTEIYLHHYDDTEFYRDLETIEGNIERIKEYPNNKKDILKREIYFRIKIRDNTSTSLAEYFKNILYRIINDAHKFTAVFHNVVEEY